MLMAAKLPAPGQDGSVLHVRERVIPGTRAKQITAERHKPGTFGWRYARGLPGSEKEMLYHAGSEFSLIIERAGMKAPGTVDWTREGQSAWTDLLAARLDAMNEWKKMTRELGKLVSARLVQYIVEGKTADQVGKIYGMGSRAAAFVLESDLKAVAEYFGYLGRR